MSFGQYVTVFDGRDIYDFPNGYRVAVTFHGMSAWASVHIPNLPPPAATRLNLDVHDVARVPVDDLDELLADVANQPAKESR